jgi:hypothetical protein
MPDRLLAVAVVVLLVAMAAAMTTAALGESQTYDEGFHLVAGFSYWQTRDFRLNQEHPPLAKLWCALPLLFTPVVMPNKPDAWKEGDQTQLYADFLYRNRLPADTILFLGRAMTMVLTLGLGAFLAYVARARWGNVAALVTAAAYATDPNFIAHGHYVTTDAVAALTVLWSALTWDRYLTTGRRLHLVLASLALGIALAAKFSAVFLVPVHWLVYWLRRPHGPRRPLIASAGAAVVVLAAYGSWYGGALAAAIPDTTPTGTNLRAISSELRLPAHPYLLGLWSLTSHNEDGHRSYLAGKVREDGTALYFPIAFLVKTPSWVLLASAVALALAVVNWKRIPRATWLLALYPAVYFLLCVKSRLNLGVRHLSPVYPFLYLLIGWAAARLLASRSPLNGTSPFSPVIGGYRFRQGGKGSRGCWRRPALAGLVALACIHMVELARTHPHYTAFFNSFAGGPANGHRWLLDSNVDWGQDAKKLKRWMEANGIRHVCVSYFGLADLAYYQIPHEVLDPSKKDCYAAVSVNHYHDLYHPAGTHKWLHGRKPIANIGYSILIFPPAGRL